MKKIAKTKKILKKVSPAPKMKVGPAKKVKVISAPKIEIKAKSASGPYEEIKTMLIQQKKALLAEAGVIIENTLNPANEAFPDWTDQASVEADQNFVLRLREREQQLLMKIDDAIERINEGAFGICEGCSGEISFKRLKARPVTTLCIECKTKQETEEKIRQE